MTHHYRNPSQPTRAFRRATSARRSQQALYRGTRRQHPGARLAAEPCCQEGVARDLPLSPVVPAPESTVAACRRKADIRPDYRVPCKIAEDEVDAAELSLAENVMRDDMHPADRFEAFRDLVDKGPLDLQTLPPVSARPIKPCGSCSGSPASPPPCSRRTARAN